MRFFTVFTRYSHLRSTGLGIKHEPSTKQPLRMTDSTSNKLKCIDRPFSMHPSYRRSKYRDLNNGDGDAEDNAL